MSERKNIDRLFQEKFKDFEVNPPERIWKDIEAELKQKKKRRVVPIWFRLSGVAAIFLIGLFIAGPFTTDTENSAHKPVVAGENKNDNASGPTKNDGSTTPSEGIAITNEGQNSESNPDQMSPSDPANSTNPAPAVSDVETPKPNNHGKKPLNNTITEKEVHNRVPQVAAANQPKNNKEKRTVRSQNRRNNNNEIVLPQNDAIADAPKNSNDAAAQGIAEKTASGTQNVPEKNSDRMANQDHKKVTSNEPSEKNTSQGVDPAIKATLAETTLEKTDSTAIAVVPNALEKLFNEKEQEKPQLTTAEPKMNRWQITSNVAPIYFSSLSNGSPLDSRFESNKKSYTPTVAYGVGVQYAVNKKLTIRSGVNALGLEYDTNDIVFFQTPDARRIENVKANFQGSLIQVENSASVPMAATLGRTIKQYTGSLNQRTGYIEVPVEMSYKILDNKFGIEVIGGFSTLYLNQNEVSIRSNALDMMIGEATNLNDFHFSTNVGLGVKYDFLKAFQAYFEPTFKYQLNTFSSDSRNFKPYFLGLYTGVSYRF